MNRTVASVPRVLIAVCVTSLPTLAYAQAATAQPTESAGSTTTAPAVNAPSPASEVTAAPATQPAVTTAPPVPPPQAVAPPSPPTPVVAPVAAAPPAAEPAPAPAAEKPKAVNIGVWLRSALRFQGAAGRKKMDDQSLSYYAELHISGAIYDKFNYTLNFNVANSPNDYPGTVHVMDAIAQFEPVKEFNLWMGQMLVPSDRSNFSGPFFMSPWNYPGVYAVGRGLPVTFVGPAEGPAGRNAGTTAWGDIGNGLFKYYAGVYNLTDVGQSPLYSGRLNLSPIGKEPGFYHSSTYYGDKDVLALGVGAQFQKNGSASAAGADDFSEVNADLLAEFKVGDTVLTGEGAFYHFGGTYNPVDNAFYILGSVLTPKVGPGSFQPLLRYQWAKKDTPATSMSIIDAQLAYVVKPYALRGLVNYQRTNMDNGNVGNAVQLGVQLMTL